MGEWWVNNDWIGKGRLDEGIGGGMEKIMAVMRVAWVGCVEWRR